MPGFDALAPDQKAVLQLLLKRGMTYDEIAGLLRLDRANVRERALDALDALGAGGPGTGSAGALSSERQDEVGDHLLLQQTASERAATRQFLESSAPSRAWARTVAAELGPIGGDALPDIPAEPAELAEAFDALDERTAARERQDKSSKLGGVLILAAIGAVIGLGILLFVRAGDDEPVTTTNAPATTAQSSTGTTGAGVLPKQQINLNPPSSSSSSRALAFAIIADGELAFQAEGLRQSDLYDVWLYNSPSDALALGFAVYDRTTRRLAGATRLPAEALNYGSVVITRQKTRKPTAPGTIVLQGPIKRP